MNKTQKTTLSNDSDCVKSTNPSTIKLKTFPNNSSVKTTPFVLPQSQSFQSNNKNSVYLSIPDSNSFVEDLDHQQNEEQYFSGSQSNPRELELKPRFEKALGSLGLDRSNENIMAEEIIQPNQQKQQHTRQPSSLFRQKCQRGLERFEGVEASLKQSISMLKSMNDNYDCQSSRNVYKAPEQNKNPNMFSLFDFLHCFPPSAMLKIIPTQQAIKNLNSTDQGKLALVPTEVLLDMRESRQYLQSLVESQQQVIQLMRKQMGQKGDNNQYIRESYDTQQTNNHDEQQQCKMQ